MKSTQPFADYDMTSVDEDIDKAIYDHARRDCARMGVSWREYLEIALMSAVNRRMSQGEACLELLLFRAGGADEVREKVAAIRRNVALEPTRASAGTGDAK